MFLLRCLNDAITRFNLVPESGSAEDCDKGEVGGIEVFPMLRLGDGSRFPSRGNEPFVFILGPWMYHCQWSPNSSPDKPEELLKGRMVRDLHHQMTLSAESPVLVELARIVQVLMLDSRPQLTQMWKALSED